MIAVVAGATRGTGRGIAVALGAAGATVYCAGRSTRGRPSEMNRPETIEETAELVEAAGGKGVAVTPGFLRSEAMPERFGVTEDTWREAGADRAWMVSETPAYTGRGVAALALDRDRLRWSGRSVTSGDLAEAYGLTDVDGSRPQVWRYITEVLEKGGDGSWEDYR